MITQFQQKVYDATRMIPRGSVITYGELARRIGCGSARAVGQALRVNPFAPEVPCHRVVAADGSLTGFYGHRDDEALAKKRALLQAEGVAFDEKGRVLAVVESRSPEPKSPETRDRDQGRARVPSRAAALNQEYLSQPMNTADNQMVGRVAPRPPQCETETETERPRARDLG